MNLGNAGPFTTSAIGAGNGAWYHYQLPVMHGNGNLPFVVHGIVCGDTQVSYGWKVRAILLLKFSGQTGS